MSCFNNSCNNDPRIYKEAIEKIKKDQEFLNNSGAFIINQIGPTGPTAPMFLTTQL